MSKPKYKPITLEDLCMTEDEMELFQRGAKFLFGDESDATTEDETRAAEADSPAKPDVA